MWFNPIMRWLISSPFHFFVSKNILLLTYTGKKSGNTYSTPIDYLELDGALYTVSSRDRVWWRNLRQGAGVTLRLQGEDVQARAEVVEAEDQVEQILIPYFQAAPQIAKYLNIDLNDKNAITEAAKERVVIRTKINE